MSSQVVELLLGREPPAAAMEDLLLYLEQVRAWSARVDLIAPRSEAEFLDLSLADAALLARFELEHGQTTDRLVDVGSGGGAPGIPLGILLAHLRGGPALTLVEPRTKRVAFLRSVAGRLSANRPEVVRGRSDALATRSFNVALARATLPPAAWVLEGARLATDAVWLLLAKDDAPCLDGFTVNVDVRYAWPLTGVERRALRYARNVADGLNPA